MTIGSNPTGQAAHLNAPTDDHRLDALLFRRQFVLGPHRLDWLPSWNWMKIRDDLWLGVHPDLKVHHAARAAKSVTLLGWALDPYHPDASDADIVAGLLDGFCERGFDDLLKRTSSLGGRWIMIADDGDNARLVHDATGLRQVVVATLPSGVWCASQPGLIAETFHLEKDPAALQFLESCRRRGNHEYWWPGDRSEYQEIKRLLPNHYLDLKTGSAHRFWPDASLKRIALKGAVEEIVGVLRGLVRGAHRRFALALGITAGWHTRIVLAALREVKDQVFFYTQTFEQPYVLTKDSEDAAIPARLLKKLGLSHHLIPTPSRMDDRFRAIYDRNVTSARPVYGPMAQGLYQHYPPDRVCVKGNCVEIGECFYRMIYGVSKDYERRMTGQELAALTNLDPSPFVVQALGEWIAGAREQYNVGLLDLFFWEMRIGSWQAMNQLEWDMVQDAFTPFNCRHLLGTMMSVDAKDRIGPKFKLQRTIMLALWPEVLSEPLSAKTRWSSPISKLQPGRVYRFLQRRVSDLLRSPRRPRPWKIRSKG